MTKKLVPPMLSTEDRFALYEAHDIWMNSQEVEPRDRAYYLVQMAAIYHAIWCIDNDSSDKHFLKGLKILNQALSEGAVKIFKNMDRE